MPQEFLYHPQVGPAVKHMGGKGVPQHVGVYPPLDTSNPGVFLQYLLHPALNQALTLPADKYGITPLFAEELGTALL